MKRVDIYYKYVSNFKFDSASRDKKLDVCIKGIKYSAFRVNSKLWFYRVDSVKYNELYSWGLVDDSGKFEDGIILKLNIHSYIGGMPVMSIPYLNICDYNGDSKIWLDLSGSDLSNILLFSPIGYLYSLYLLKLPEDKDKRLKPISIGNIFALLSDRLIQKLIKNIDTSELECADELFYCSGIESIDFNSFKLPKLKYARRMFSGCNKLKKITGKLSGCGCVVAKCMFIECTELEEIPDSLFEGTKVCSVDSMFYKCSKLRSIPLIDVASLEYARDKYGIIEEKYDYDLCEYTFYNCYNIPKDVIRNTMIMCIRRGISMRGIMGGIVMGDIMHHVTIDMSNNIYLGVVSDSDDRYIDLSKTRFIYPDNSDLNILGIVDLVYNSKELGVGLYNQNYTGLMCAKSLIAHGCIVVANSTLRLFPVDYKIFNVIEMQDSSDEEIRLIVEKIKALDYDEGRYLIIVNNTNN